MTDIDRLRAAMQHDQARLAGLANALSAHGAAGLANVQPSTMVQANALEQHRVTLWRKFYGSGLSAESAWARADTCLRDQTCPLHGDALTERSTCPTCGGYVCPVCREMSWGDGASCSHGRLTPSR